MIYVPLCAQSAATTTTTMPLCHSAAIVVVVDIVTATLYPAMNRIEKNKYIRREEKMTHDQAIQYETMAELVFVV